MLLSDAVEAYVKDRSGRGEIGAYSACLFRSRLAAVVRAVGDVELECFTPAAVALYQRAVAAQRPNSRRSYFATLSRFCRWLVEEELIERDPTLRMVRVRLPASVPKALGPVQLARLASVLPDDRARAVVALQSRLGLRCGEVANLEVSDWDRAARTLVVKGKFDDERRLPVPLDVANVLETYLGGRTSGSLIGWTAGWVSKQLSRWMDEAGLKSAPRDGISAHALRRTAASDLYAQTHDVRLAQRLLGHRNIATTDRYLRPGDMDELRAALDDPSRSVFTTRRGGHFG